MGRLKYIKPEIIVTEIKTQTVLLSSAHIIKPKYEEEWQVEEISEDIIW